MDRPCSSSPGTWHWALAVLDIQGTDFSSSQEEDAARGGSGQLSLPAGEHQLRLVARVARSRVGGSPRKHGRRGVAPHMCLQLVHLLVRVPGDAGQQVCMWTYAGRASLQDLVPVLGRPGSPRFCGPQDGNQGELACGSI